MVTTTNNDNSREKTVAELFQAAGLVTPKSPTRGTSSTARSSARWRITSIIVALLALASVVTAVVHH